MSTFGDELRNLIAKKAEQLGVAEMLRSRQRREDQRKRDDLDAAAAGVCRDVFMPLLEEFSAALVAAGVFFHAPGDNEILLGRHKSGAHLCKVNTRGAAGRYRVRFFAAASPEGRIELTAECMVRKAGVRSRESEAGSQMAYRIKTPLDELFSAAMPPTPRPPSPLPLVEIAPKNISPETAKMQHPSVEEWCRTALKKCAEAIVAAERLKNEG